MRSGKISKILFIIFWLSFPLLIVHEPYGWEIEPFPLFMAVLGFLHAVLTSGEYSGLQVLSTLFLSAAVNFIIVFLVWKAVARTLSFIAASRERAGAGQKQTGWLPLILFLMLWLCLPLSFEYRMHYSFSEPNCCATCTRCGKPNVFENKWSVYPFPVGFYAAGTLFSLPFRAGMQRITSDNYVVDALASVFVSMTVSFFISVVLLLIIRAGLRFLGPIFNKRDRR